MVSTMLDRAQVSTADDLRRTLPLAGRALRRYWVVLVALIVATVGVVFLTMSYGNPLPFGSEGYWTIARLRAKTLVIVAVVAGAQSIATISFQTVTHNRILTPGIMGFESLYRLIQTSAVFFLGVAGITFVTGLWQFLAQILLMVIFAAVLYGWLFGGRRGNLQITLLVGIIIGGGLNAIATFMQRLLDPSDFDLLISRLIGSLAHAREEYLVPSIILLALAGGTLWSQSRSLNVLALGRESAINLGINHRRRTLAVLVLTAILMATSTALVGPMTFLGFLVAMIAYQLTDTYDHRYLFPVAWLLGFVILAGAHFVLRNIFYASGSVSVIIELVGGGFFLFYIIRKGRL